jgi:hypothetical protein
MSKTALLDGLRALDLDAVRRALDRTPALADLVLPNGFNLLQACCARRTAGVTPLHRLMARGCDPAVFALLLRHGADPDRPGPDGRSAREVARRKRDTRYARAIEARSGQVGAGRA